MSNIVSSKYQIVIPKDVRKKLGIKPGQRMRLSATKNDKIIMQKDEEPDIDTIVQKYAGILKTSETEWGKAGMDPAEWIREMRDEEWD